MTVDTKNSLGPGPTTVSPLRRKCTEATVGTVARLCKFLNSIARCCRSPPVKDNIQIESARGASNSKPLPTRPERGDLRKLKLKKPRALVIDTEELNKASFL